MLSRFARVVLCLEANLTPAADWAPDFVGSGASTNQLGVKTSKSKSPSIKMLSLSVIQGKRFLCTLDVMFLSM